MYAGLYCQNQATTYCTFDQEVSQTSFCTNGGTCEAIVSAESAHLGCTCSSNYEGPHCQFVKGTRPDGWPYDGSTLQNGYSSLPLPTNKNEMDGGVKAVIVLVVLGVVGAMAFYVYKKKMAHSTPLSKDIAMGSELALDADGSNLHDSASFNGLTSTKEFSSELGEDENLTGEMI